MGWYDDDSLGGLEKTVEKMVNTDPNFGIVYSILVYAVVYMNYETLIECTPTPTPPPPQTPISINISQNPPPPNHPTTSTQPLSPLQTSITSEIVSYFKETWNYVDWTNDIESNIT